MRSSIHGESANSSLVGESDRLVPGNEGKSGDTGTRKVDPIAGSDVSRTTSTEDGHRETNREVLQTVQPSEGKRVIGGSSNGSPEEQLKAILSDTELANCYRSQAKDDYCSASDHTFKALQEVMDGIDLGADHKKIAKKFKAAVNRIRQKDLAHFERDTSDLKVTITTQETGSVQLIPFELKEIDPELLKRLVGKAALLSTKAMAQTRMDPEYIPRKIYLEKIASTEDMIHPILEKLDSESRSALLDEYKFLKFPRVKVHFDGASDRSTGKFQDSKKAPHPSQPDKLAIANAGVLASDDERLEEEKTLDNQDRTQKALAEEETRLESAKAAQLKYLRDRTNLEKPAEFQTQQGEIAQEIKMAARGRPKARWDGVKETSQKAVQSEDATVGDFSHGRSPGGETGTPKKRVRFDDRTITFDDDSVYDTPGFQPATGNSDPVKAESLLGPGDVVNDGFGLFRALFAYQTRDSKWKSAAKDEVCRKIREKGTSKSIKAAIKKAIEQYPSSGAPSEVQNIIAQKLGQTGGSDDLVEQIFDRVIADREFSEQTFNGLREVLNTATDDSCARELKTLSSLIIRNLAVELKVPMSRNNGLQRQEDVFELVVDPSYFDD